MTIGDGRRNEWMDGAARRDERRKRFVWEGSSKIHLHSDESYSGKHTVHNIFRLIIHSFIFRSGSHERRDGEKRRRERSNVYRSRR